MACFVAPLGEAIVQKVVEKREEKAGGEKAGDTGIKWSRRLGWLNKMLWGGTVLLAFEHVWHGEVVPWPPFLTAMQSPAEIGPMLREIATVGVGMAVFVTLVWAIIVVIAEHKVKVVPEAKTAPAGGGE
jgi:hypothetical protein